MKKVNQWITFSILAGLQAIACGPTKQDPLEDYRGLQLSSTPQPQQKISFEYVEKQVPGPEINNYVPVTTERAVTVEKLVIVPEQLQPVVSEITVSEYPILISTTNDKVNRTNNMVFFFEGIESTSCIQVKINFNSAVTFDLDIQGIPENMIKTREQMTDNSAYATNTVKYCLKWLAPAGIIAQDATFSEDKITVTIKDLRFTDVDQNKNRAMEMIFNQVSKGRDIPVMIYKNTPEIIQLLNNSTNQTRQPGEV